MRLNKDNQAQVVTELAVFGFILIFILGAILRYAVNDAINQNQRLMAMRYVLRNSLETSETGILNGCPAFPKNPAMCNSSARNFASVMYIEDRTVPEAGKYGTISRTPYLQSAAGSMSKNLFMPVEYGDIDDLPLMDIYVNNILFHLTTAGYAEYFEEVLRTGFNLGYRCQKPGLTPIQLAECIPLKRLVPNGGADSDYDSGCAECFDLDHDGAPNPVGSTASFSWQWQTVDATTSDIDLQTGLNLSLDVDWDMREEQIVEILVNDGTEGGTWYNPRSDPQPKKNLNIIGVRVMDFQKGDINLTKPDSASEQAQQRSIMMESYTFSGTELVITEAGRAKTMRQSKNRLDVIERIMMIDNNTGRLCGGCGPDFLTAVVSSIEACGACESEANQYLTCFEQGACGECAGDGCPLYIRSRIEDTRGAIWNTSYRRMNE